MEKKRSSKVYKKEKIGELFTQDIIDDIKERFVKVIDNFWKFIENHVQTVSGWSFLYIKGINLKTFDYDVIAGGTYIDLPKKIKNKQACINVQNNDEMCLKWSILSALHHKDILRDLDRVTKYHQYANELNETGMQYPVVFNNKSMMMTVEDNNRLLITVLGLDDDDTVIVYRSPRYARRDVQYDYYEYRPILLLMIHNADGNSHYV